MRKQVPIGRVEALPDIYNASSSDKLHIVRSPVRKTIRCSENDACTSCPEHRCKFPVYCYADPLELTLSWLLGDETDDSEIGSAIHRAGSALAQGRLEEAEVAIDYALDLLNEMRQRQSYV